MPDNWIVGSVTDFSTGLRLDDEGPSVGIGAFAQLDNLIYTEEGRLKTRDALVPAPFSATSPITLSTYPATTTTTHAGCTETYKPRDLIMTGDGYQDDMILAVEAAGDTKLYKFALTGDGRSNWDSITG